MPYYDYVCDSCGHRCEIQQSIKDSAVSECPSCRKPTFRRLISRVGLVFKGSGFYVNDYGPGRNRSEDVLDD
jgi:putative FmdB family regulatory protein